MPGTFNLNRTHSGDYKLKNNHINELINIYGVEVDFLYTRKMNRDKILMDFSHMKTDKDTQKIMLLPEEGDQWGGVNQWDMFGLNNLRTISFFMSKESLDTLLLKYKEKYENINNYKEFINSLLVLPNGSFLEISDIEGEVDGINNLFTYDDLKSVYRITTKIYHHSKQDEIEHSSTDLTKETIDSDTIPGIDTIIYSDDKIIDDSLKDIDEYFNSLDEVTDNQNEEGAPKMNDDSVFGTLG